MTRIFLLAFMFATYAQAQVDKPIESKITDATVFLSKAQITREAKTRVDAGKTNLIVTGLTAQLDPQSIQVTGKGNFVILGISHQVNYLNEFTVPKSLKTLRDSLETLQRQLSIEQSQKEILNKEEQMLLSNQKIGGTTQNLSVNELKAMADFYRARLSELVTSRMKQEDKIKRLNERIAKVNAQINQQTELYARNTSEVVITVSAESPTSVELEVNYIVANAGWYPVYDLRAINTKSPLQLSYKANVFQSTGEEWKSVHLKLSSANPSQSGLKPELNAWYLNFYTPRVMTERNYGVRSKSMAAPASMERNAAKSDVLEVVEEARTTGDYVNTIQTTLNTEFDISLPYTVLSASKPTLVDVRNHQLKAEYNYSVAPKLDVDAFLLAKATGWEEFNLLPGEANIFFEGTFVGKTFIDPNNIKDTLSLSLGRDKRIVVKREKLKDLTSRKLIGTSQKESYSYEISVRNTKSEPIRISVEDQIPVSQNSQIEVTTIDLGAANYSATTGKMTWNWNIQPGETKRVAYKFEVKYPKDRQIEGL